MKILLLNILLLQSAVTLASNINGIIHDQDNQVIIGATVVLLEQQDSSMTTFALSNQKGAFTLEDVDDGEYILQISFVSYSTMYLPVRSTGKDIDLGILQLQFTSEVLQEVTVKADHIPMGILGDTISYNASAFKTRPGASVEDLLKKLPGIEVARDGSIKAMGEDVENVLVEGKEFFGSDPKIATKNLEAEAVDKVEVFDKKSEIAEFTGIDDGNDEKTLNLKLKEGHKSGGFGRVNAEGGSDSRYYGKLNYNRFSPRLQASVIANTNNVNEQAFTFNEYIQFMGGIGNAMANMNSSFQFSEFGNGMSPQGITDNISSGINFNFDFSKKLTLNSHYFLVATDLDRLTSTSSNQFSDLGDFMTDNESQLNHSNNLHRLNTKVKWNHTPLSQIILKNNLQGNWNDLVSENITSYFSNNMDQGNTTGFRTLSERQLGYEGSAQWRKKFETKGKSLISTIQYQTGSHNENGTIMNQFNLTGTEVINQVQEYVFNKNIWEVKSEYTNPLGRNWYLGLAYNLRNETESPFKSFFDIRNEDLIPNLPLTNAYQKKQFSQRPQFNIRKNTSKLTSKIGLGMQWTQIDGIADNFTNPINNNTYYVLPFSNIEWKFSSMNRISLDYNTQIRTPSLSQLAPLPDNSNPNVFIEGNPLLDPQYEHNAILSYHSYDQFSFRNFSWNLMLISQENAIVNAISVNEDLTRTYRPINSMGFKRLSSRISYSSPIRALKLKYNTKLNFARSNYQSLLNESTNNVAENKIEFEFNIENRNKDNWDISTGVRFNYSDRSFRENINFSQEFFNYSLFADIIAYLGNDWTIGTTIDRAEYSNEFFSDRQIFTLWNASISKTFDENRFGIELKVFDILKQNQGISRSGTLNSIYEQRFNTLTQYFSLGLSYKLGKSKRNTTTIQFN